MAIVNQTNLESQIQTRVNAKNSSSNMKDMVANAIAAVEFCQDVSLSVPTASALPDLSLSTIPNGTLVFVESLNVHVIASNEQWIGLDGRLLRNDASTKTVWSWGRNNSGQLGHNTATTASVSSPVSVVGGFTDWCQISVGLEFSVGIRTNGTVWSWGANSSAMLGDGTTTDRSSPVSVVGGFTDWCQVSAGWVHAAAIRTNGTLWGWGAESAGRLGNLSTFLALSSPVSVVGGFTDWCQVSAGFEHTTAVRANGTLWTWGCGAQGRLGDGTNANRSSPVSVVGGFTDWCQVSASYHTAAVRANGTLWTWGCGAQGRLGDGTNANRSSPVSVVGGFTDWCQVSAGSLHTAAVRTNGTLWAWGYAGNGRLGDGTTTERSSPVSVVGGFTDWCQVSAAAIHTAAVRTNGTLWAWGYNGQGRLGDGTSINRSSPVSVVGGFTDWCQVSSCRHTIALRVQQ